MFLPRTSFHSDTFGGVTKFRLLSQARRRLILLNFRVLLILHLRKILGSIVVVVVFFGVFDHLALR